MPPPVDESNAIPLAKAAELADAWIGTPDPSRYGPNTTYLPPDELEAEVKQGNVIKLKVCMSCDQCQYQAGIICRCCIAHA